MSSLPFSTSNLNQRPAAHQPGDDETFKDRRHHVRRQHDNDCELAQQLARTIQQHHDALIRFEPTDKRLTAVEGGQKDLCKRITTFMWIIIAALVSALSTISYWVHDLVTQIAAML